MTFDELVTSLAQAAPPPGLTPELRALWLDGKGDWAGAHEAAGDIETPAGARLHAYLHRKEGDLDNARYWYGQAGRAVETGPLGAEWEALARAFLAG
jgi:hypothetical protein